MMAKRIVQFTIDDLPMTINEIGRLHWSVKAKEARRWKNLVIAHCAALKINGLNLKKAELTFTRHSAREMDADNLAISFKHPLDGLVKAEVIKDDKPSIIGQPKYLWQFAPKGKGFISIEVSWDEADETDSTPKRGKKK